MIKADNCNEFMTGYRFKDGDNITLDFLKGFIEDSLDKYQMPVIVEYDQLKSGGLFTGEVIDCITIRNSNHKYDYYTIVVTYSLQGVFGFANFFITGMSTNLDIPKHKAMGANKKAQDELMYYDSVKHIIDSILS